MSTHDLHSGSRVRRSDLRRRTRRGVLGLLPRLRALPSPMRPAGGAVVFA